MSDCLCITFLLCSFTFTVGVLCCFIFTFSLRLAVQYWDWLHKISLRLLCASSLEWQVEQVAVNCNSTCMCVCAAECKLVPDTASFLGSQGWLSSISVLCLYSVSQCWKVLVFHFPRVGCLYITFPPSPYYGSIYNQMLAWATKRIGPHSYHTTLSAVSGIVLSLDPLFAPRLIELSSWSLYPSIILVSYSTPNPGKLMMFPWQ